MWANFYRDGGWGMIPTTIFGFVLLASAVLLILRPERRYFALVTWLWLATLGSGVLGTAMGLIRTFRVLPQVPADQQLVIVGMGTAESLNVTVLALILCVLTGVLASIAAARAAWFPSSTTAG